MNEQGMKKRAYRLLKSWCDNMLRYQIAGMNNPLLDGAIICPGCANVHGRIADLVYPLLISDITK